jgi:hypothetical protein
VWKDALYVVGRTVWTGYVVVIPAKELRRINIGLMWEMWSDREHLLE